MGLHIWLEFDETSRCQNQILALLCSEFEFPAPNVTQTAQHRGDFSPHQTLKGSGEAPKWENAWDYFCSSHFGLGPLEICCSTLYFDLFPLFSQSHI